MDRLVSLRLDALRALAALMVFIYHLSYLGYAGRALPAEVGRLGVLVFFVMSGYVIAYVTECKHRDLQHYMNARFARLFYVFLPALLLTVVCDALGRELDSALYTRYPDVYEARAWLRLPFFIGFLFENALFSLRWFSNGPMWSIAYEFWYYALYGVLAYTSGQRRLALLASALLLAGWKIMLLAPVWWAGVLLYRHQHRVAAAIELRRVQSFWLGATLLLAGLLPAVRAHTAALGDWGGRLLGVGMHMFFLSDYLQMLPLLLLVAT
jgi:peptidoglycan/LPS O-acetylase OafA/YrhL